MNTQKKIKPIIELIKLAMYVDIVFRIKRAWSVLATRKGEPTLNDFYRFVKRSKDI